MNADIILCKFIVIRAPFDSGVLSSSIHYLEEIGCYVVVRRYVYNPAGGYDSVPYHEDIFLSLPEALRDREKDVAHGLVDITPDGSRTLTIYDTSRLTPEERGAVETFIRNHLGL
jgi:hypothetical protein